MQFPFSVHCFNAPMLRKNRLLTGTPIYFVEFAKYVELSMQIRSRAIPQGIVL